MKYFILGVLFIFANISFAAKLSKSEVLKLMDKGRMSFEIKNMAKEEVVGRLMCMNGIEDKSLLYKMGSAKLQQMEKVIVQSYQMLYKYFDPEMLNVRYLDYSGYRYFIIFDFAKTRQCKLYIEELDPNCMDISCNRCESREKVLKRAERESKEGFVISDQYCEKVYNIKLKK